MTTRRLDLDAIMAVMDAAFDPAFGEAWSLRQFTGAMAMPGTSCLTIDETGRIDGDGPPVGFALSRRVADEEAELLLLAVAPEWRGRGLGRQLVATLLERCRKSGIETVFLEMREDNPAHRFYAGLGFSNVGRRPNYYRGRDGVVRDAITCAMEVK